MYKDKLLIVKGSVPKNNYEVIVNNNLSDIFKLNKYIDEIKINGNKLKVVGYYTSLDDINSYFVSSNYVMNIWVLLLCLVIVCLFNIIVGLIPVFNKMRKTPVQILARHNLD